MEKINNKPTVDKIGARLAKLYEDVIIEELPQNMADRLRVLHQAEEAAPLPDIKGDDPASE